MDGSGRGVWQKLWRTRSLTWIPAKDLPPISAPPFSSSWAHITASHFPPLRYPWDHFWVLASPLGKHGGVRLFPSCCLGLSPCLVRLSSVRSSTAWQNSSFDCRTGFKQSRPAKTINQAGFWQVNSKAGIKDIMMMLGHQGLMRVIPIVCMIFGLCLGLSSKGNLLDKLVCSGRVAVADVVGFELVHSLSLAHTFTMRCCRLKIAAKRAFYHSHLKCDKERPLIRI